MIVTRQRRKPFPWRRLILPAIALLLVALALLWPPSRNAIFNGPAAPMARTAGSWFDVVATPFHFAAQNEVITDRNRQIAVLQNQLTASQADAGSKDKQIQALQQQVDQLQSQAASARNGTNAPKGGASPAPSPSGGSFANNSAQGATPDIERTAQYWASMDPENAAKIAQRLPPSYVARVFAQMQANDVGAILDALPATYAAKLTQEHPQIQH